MRNGNPSKPKLNLVKEDDIIVSVISQAYIVTNVKDWVVDFSATMHIYIGKNTFTSYTSEGMRRIYISWWF